MVWVDRLFTQAVDYVFQRIMFHTGTQDPNCCKGSFNYKIPQYLLDDNTLRGGK